MSRAFYSNSTETYKTYDGSDLGFTYTPERTTFKVWAPSAEQVLLKLYSTGSFHERGAQVLGIKQMNFDPMTGVWSAVVEEDLNKTYYTYVIKTETGTHETQDVYSKAVGVNSARSMVVDLRATDPEGWENDKRVLPDTPNDAVIWEIHVRDFSSSDTSGISRAHRGKFLAFTEKNTTVPFTDYPTCVAYLKELGVTHIQLNPVLSMKNPALNTTGATIPSTIMFPRVPIPRIPITVKSGSGNSRKWSKRFTRKASASSWMWFITTFLTRILLPLK